MNDERAFIARLESADAGELAGMLARPTVEEEKTLRVYLGDARYERMHALALRRNVRRAMGRPRGNVVVIPGIMGSELTTVDRRGDQDHVWVQVPRLAIGRLARLRLDEKGLAEHDPNYDVHATGVLKKYYGELLLSLSEHWTVRAFWYDWRKDLNLAADELKARLGGWFGEDAPVHIVAHSMGGLVARTFMKNHPERWKKMRGKEEGAGGRLIMLGTPNHGSFMIPQAIAGIAPIVRQLALLDIFHSVAELLPIMNSFVGSYQMLPSPLRLPEMERLYEPAAYGGLAVPRARLTNALRHHEALRTAVDPERMLYVAGRDQPTIGSIEDFGNLADLHSYGVTTRGDGTVSHELGLLAAEDGTEVGTYYIEEEHGNLASNARILASLDELLETGKTDALEREPTAGKRGAEADGEDARRRWISAQAAEEERLETLVARNSLRSAGGNAEAYVSDDERQIEEIVTREFLGHDGHKDGAKGVPEAPFPTASIEIGLVCGDLEDLPYARVKSAVGDPVDAISVGHYINVRPQGAELALDRAISGALRGEEDGAGLPDSDLLLTQYFERGIIRGRLGQPFFLPDPRPGKAGRLIAIAGMGLPGGFGAPELAVLARELCWSLGRVEKRHLATVLIGAGTGNLSTREAVSAWMRGIKNAVTGSIEDEGRRLLRVTFVERDPDTVMEMAEAFEEEKRRLEGRNRLLVDLHKPSEAQLERKREERRREPGEADRGAPGERPPARITLRLDGDTYRFGAITESASVPERDVPLDPALVMEANKELAAESDAAMQLERGGFLRNLLVPVDLRDQFTTDAPLVMMLDSTIARIHWEMVAHPDNTPAGDPSEFDPDAFLGTGRGFTRQLRTTLAPPPEPPPPPRRILRVLVVADPAEDAHLPGAEEEGAEVAALFESFNAVYEHSSYSRVEVVRLFGPYAATRTNVLRTLMSRSFDVLHFAGHCVYDENPRRSGWLFSGGKFITANELGRIDRVPKFVFSNACESGVTPDRSEMRSDQLAPSFAERFFERGITDFVCTAWPVEDLSARTFALTLYAGLLGLQRPQGGGNRYEEAPPQPMYAAMREARLSIADSPDGARTWGAYQHYGSPYFRFFDRETITERRSESGVEAAAEPALRNGQGARSSTPNHHPQHQKSPGRRVTTN